MTITHTIPRHEYTGDGTQTVFDFTFRVFDTSNLKVYLNGTEMTSGFTLNENNIEFITAPESGSQIIIVRTLNIQRQTDFQQSTIIKASDLNFDLDYLTACLQDMQEQLNRVPIQPINHAADQMELPIPESGKAIVWNEEENGLENTEVNITELAGEVAQSATKAETVYQNILNVLTGSADAGVLGLVSNLIELIRSNHPDSFDEMGWVTETAGLTENYGEISETATLTVNYD